MLHKAVWEIEEMSSTEITGWMALGGVKKVEDMQRDHDALHARKK